MSEVRSRVLFKPVVLALTLSLAGPLSAADYSPNVGPNAPHKLLWGDTHIHTAWSADAGAIGARIDPEQAIRFARGEEMTSSTGQKVRLSRPLDFVVIADHAEALGIVQELAAAAPGVTADPTGKRWSEMMRQGPKEATAVAFEMINALATGKLPPFIKDQELRSTIWKRNTAVQDKYYEPGRFTTLIGYEWTSMPGGGNNLHRNIIFRDGKDKADQITPLSAIESDNPEDLWRWLQDYETKTGGQVLAIPHNGNISNGMMFALSTFAGTAMTREYAQMRARWEPVYEVTQPKGDGEAHPSLSPTDEFANFERWDSANLNGVPKKPEMLKTEYARQALKDGLAIDARLGANPFKFGMIGSTDIHTGLSTPDESNFFGKTPMVEPSPNRIKHPVSPGVSSDKMGASGLAAVWSRDNSRESIWDALKRREVYGTTGTRMGVRLFAGYDFTPTDVYRADWAELGYSKGVPMGGDLKTTRDAKGKAKAPVFMIQAAKDPLGANLDRVQVIKGWLDAQGNVQEKIHDVAWAGQQEKTRKPGKNGKLPPVGSTVNVAEASYSNSIGSTTLTTVWKDPAFDPAQKAFYYVRVIEIPTPRWTAYDAKRFGITMPAQVPMVLQERAYSSPVWYNPS